MKRIFSTSEIVGSFKNDEADYEAFATAEDQYDEDYSKLPIETAAGMLASKTICASLGIKPEEDRFRFGFAAGTRPA